MKKIILSFVLCSLALIGAAQKFDVEKLFQSEGTVVIMTHNGDSILFERYKTNSPGLCRTDMKTREKLHKALFGQVVTPQMKKIFKQEYPKLGKDKCWMNVSFVFEKATGRIVDVAFVITDDFLKVFTEKNLREMYRRLMKLSIDTAGITYSPYRQGPISAMEFMDFLKPALEGK